MADLISALDSVELVPGPPSSATASKLTPSRSCFVLPLRTADLADVMETLVKGEVGEFKDAEVVGEAGMEDEEAPPWLSSSTSK